MTTRLEPPQLGRRTARTPTSTDRAAVAHAGCGEAERPSERSRESAGLEWQAAHKSPAGARSHDGAATAPEETAWPPRDARSPAAENAVLVKPIVGSPMRSQNACDELRPAARAESLPPDALDRPTAQIDKPARVARARPSAPTTPSPRNATTPAERSARSGGGSEWASRQPAFTPAASPLRYASETDARSPQSYASANEAHGLSRPSSALDERPPRRRCDARQPIHKTPLQGDSALAYDPATRLGERLLLGESASPKPSPPSRHGSPPSKPSPAPRRTGFVPAPSPGAVAANHARPRFHAATTAARRSPDARGAVVAAANAAVGHPSRVALQAPRATADGNLPSARTGWTVRFHSTGGFTALPSADADQDASDASTELSRALSTAEEIEQDLSVIWNMLENLDDQEQNAARRSTAQQQRLHEMHAENAQLQGVVISLSEGIRRPEPETPWSPVRTAQARAGSDFRA